MKSISKKASTLAELVVCMALTAILSTAIVSFCLTINVNVARHKATNDFTDDLAVVKQYVNEWVSYFDNPTYSITLSDDNKSLVATTEVTADDGTKSQQEAGRLTTQTVVEDGKSSLQIFSQINADITERTIERTMLNVTGISFEKSGSLVKCNVTYTVVGGNNTDNHKTVSFVVAMRVMGGDL